MRMLVLFVVCSLGCFLLEQEPVCPPRKPRCTMDDDPGHLEAGTDANGRVRAAGRRYRGRLTPRNVPRSGVSLGLP